MDAVTQEIPEISEFLDDPTRPPVRWHGGKWRAAPKILPYFPQHKVYVEPYGGGAGCLLRKDRVNWPCNAEVYNDLDREVVNLFRVLQDPQLEDKLIRKLQRTPFARDEFMLSAVFTRDRVERARRLILRSFMGFGSNAHNCRPTGFRSFTRVKGTAKALATGFRSNNNKAHSTPAHEWQNYPDSLRLVADRFRRVVIENRNAPAVIAQHDSPETLIYLDPPYLPETRSPANKYDHKYHMYRHELTVQGHIRLLAFAKKLKGMVIISGYPSKIYDDRLAKWMRVEFDALADGARRRTEVLWINPACAAALEREALDRTPLLKLIEGRA